MADVPLTHFIEDRRSFVGDAVDGLVLTSGGRMARLDGDAAIRVVLRADWSHDEVAVVSGGGSGHEPAHAGFVGPGLLTAAVCGDVFASPSVDAVLAAILAVTGPAGCLLIIKNYAGDRLNFGLAAERARARGLRIETLVVGDDVALPDARQPRGLAGTLLVHKVAGHAAASGASLTDVAAAARHAAGRIQSIGISVSACTLPGQAPAERRFEPGEAELGLGIHGEPGIERIALPPVARLAEQLVARFAPPVADARALGLLVNNLGATTALEMQVLTRAVLRTALGARVRLLLGPAAAMTALDMHGASLTIIALDPAIEAALTAPVDVAAWPAARPVQAARTLPLPAGLSGDTRFAASEDGTMRRRIERVCARLIDEEAHLNALDARVGDGDTGSTFAGAARAVAADIPNLPLARPADLCLALSQRLGRVAGGSSGILMSIFFAAMGTGLAEGLDAADAARRGVESLMRHGGAARGDRTLIDALDPAVAALRQGLAAAVRAAAEGAEATVHMSRAGTGRSSYLAAATLEGHPDPGAVAIGMILATLAEDA